MKLMSNGQFENTAELVQVWKGDCSMATEESLDVNPQCWI